MDNEYAYLDGRRPKDGPQALRRFWVSSDEGDSVCSDALTLRVAASKASSV